jgi:hypothetical protein
MEHFSTPFYIKNSRYKFAFVSDYCMYSRPYPKKEGYPYQVAGINNTVMPPFFRMGEHYKLSDITTFLAEHPDYTLELLSQTALF